jgi:hypothetical protein
VSARNVIEHIFGILKRRFRILQLAPEYSLDIQARIPTALCAIHNFIQCHDADEESPSATDDSFDHHNEDNEPHGEQVVDPEEENEVDQQRDQIAQAMWDDYQRVCAERDIQGGGSSSESELSDKSSDEGL